MKQQSAKSSKALIVGIVAAVLLLIVVVAVLLTQCMGSFAPSVAEPTESTAALQAESTDLYWNLDRALYDGKSEAGMSSRKAESDGFFHVRFFKDGETVELRVSDRKVINKIDVNDLMGLVFDGDGIVVDIISPDRLPVQRVGWLFYVQSTGGNVIKLNSSKALNGLEAVLQIEEDTRIYDMTGVEGEVGKEIMPTNLDRVIAIADPEGKLTHVFVTDRSEYMNSFEAECQHCGQVVTWNAWTKTDELPVTTGHYQLQNNIQLKSQPMQKEDAKICIDLNGVRVDGGKDARCYAMFNPGVELAIMDTSEKQTGVIAPHGTGDQGMGVWVRYGAFYLYGGTIDGSDAVNEIYGTCVAVQKNAYMYMLGGTITGGKAGCVYDGKVYKRGLGGNVAIEGKLVINDGVISNGYAEAIISWDAKGQPVYNRGIGGNIYVMASGVLEINGGTIQNGLADGVGGNIYMDGSSELVMNGGLISGGTIKGRGKNGGSIYVGGKATFTLNDGCIRGGVSRNEGGCVYAAGLFTMNGGYIGGGRVYDYKTGKLKEDCASRNVFVVNTQFSMYGGKIDGGVHVIDSVAKDGKWATVALGGHAIIDGGEQSRNNLFLNTAGDGVKVYALTMRDDSRIRVQATTGIFTLPTEAENTDNFVSDIPGAEILYYDGCLALGKLGCVCAHGTHIGQCDGTKYLWLPHTKTNALPMTTGYWFLTDDVALAGQQKLAGGNAPVLDLNGKTVTGSSRGILLLESSSLVITDSIGGGSIATKGFTNDSGAVMVVGDGEASIYGGTLRQIVDEGISVSGGGVVRVDANGTLNLYDGTLIGGKVSGVGGTVRVNGILNIYGGTVTGGQAVNGGNIGVNAGTVNLYGGTVEKGVATNGGNIFLANGTALNLLDGEPVITGGQMALSTGGNGGNIYAEAGSTVTMACGTIENGKALRDSAGNIYLKGSLTMSGGLITGGHRNNGGSLDKRNLFSVNGKLTVTGGQIDGGVCAYGTGGTLKLGKDARIVSNEAGKASLTLSAGALITFEGSLSGNASIVLSNAADTRICADGTADDRARITSDKGLQVTLEAGGMYLRAANAHVHCLCGRTDGTHAEGCDGFDVVFGAATAFPTTTGAYFVNAETLSTAALQLGKSDGTGAVDVVLCLNGKTVTTPNTNTARVALIWKNSSLTITDCGNGTIKPNAATAGNGAIFHPAAGSTLTLYNGTLDASDLSTAKNGAAIDNAGTLYIRGGTILGGLTTQRGGAVNNTGTLVMSGGRISGGRVGNRGGNIYSENGHVTISGGIIENGKAYADTAGNIDVRNGSLTISGGTISGGNRYTNNTFTTVHASGEVKRNIFTVNTNVTITGGQIDGGVQLYTSGSGSAKISGSPSIVSSEAGKKSLTTGYVLTILAPGLDEEARIQITSAPAGAFAVAESGLTLTSEMAACFVNAGGVKATVENNQLLFK